MSFLLKLALYKKSLRFSKNAITYHTTQTSPFSILGDVWLVLKNKPILKFVKSTFENSANFIMNFKYHKKILFYRKGGWKKQEEKTICSGFGSEVYEFWWFHVIVKVMLTTHIFNKHEKKSAYFKVSDLYKKIPQTKINFPFCK